jgi:hypothetical protein
MTRWWQNRNSAGQAHRFSGVGTESRKMLYTVQSKVLEAALNLAASAGDADEHTVAAAAIDANGVTYNRTPLDQHASATDFASGVQATHDTARSTTQIARLSPTMRRASV